MASTDQALSSKDDDQTEVTPTEKDEDDDEMQANNEQGSVDDDDDDSEDDRVPTPPGPIPEGIDKDVWKELKRVDNFQRTALHRLAEKGSGDTVTMLVKTFGADVNARDCMGQTPIHYALRFNNQSFMEALATNGADLNAKDAFGTTPLQAARTDNVQRFIKDLIADNADGSSGAAADTSSSAPPAAASPTKETCASFDDNVHENAHENAHDHAIRASSISEPETTAASEAASSSEAAEVGEAPDEAPPKIAATKSNDTSDDAAAMPRGDHAGAAGARAPAPIARLAAAHKDGDLPKAGIATSPIHLDDSPPSGGSSHRRGESEHSTPRIIDDNTIQAPLQLAEPAATPGEPPSVPEAEAANETEAPASAAAALGPGDASFDTADPGAQ